ncbi:hypothetical protein LF599_11690 [Pseudodesulfovibrio thermohalotolerans]|uniref:hypothetical protein n=1 Tax=Pseudodesulfovibrio thermohalotolerans TaxID=2880651 RepID=UPI0022B9EA80|nr:hypothetical protein [Pseudodesulfovibrio thermohalotolerans]WFS61335.1 hypothetical protein LF599_11690 [Pseudodesulfovibrio thermohalotolerans]
MAVLVAANAVLQDLGFNLDETDPELGVVVASKNRDATDGGQVFLLALLGALGNNSNAVNSADATQLVKVSLVIRHLDGDGEMPDTDLSPERIADVKQRVHDAIYDGLMDAFPKDARESIARSIAENTANTLATDLDTLLTVKDAPGSTAVRVTFQQVVFNKLGQVNSQRQINDELIYKEFFEKLSKSLFLEANTI